MPATPRGSHNVPGARVSKRGDAASPNRDRCPRRPGIPHRLAEATPRLATRSGRWFASNVSTEPAESTPRVEGIAGYVTPYPYLDRLQEKMEERLNRRVPAAGRFCGFCYARLRNEDAVCPVCATAVASRPTVQEIPQDVLQAFKLRQSIEARWVHTGAFTGMIIASLLFIWMVGWGPGLLGHPAFAFAELLLGGYFLAQLFGPLIFGQIGYRKGTRKRDEAWARFIARRDGPPPEAR